MLRRPGMPKINHLFQTSPDRWQVIWKAEEFTKSQAEQLPRGMARTYGADPAATDCARVLRLPGFINHEYAEPHVVSAEFFGSGSYRPEHFPTPLPEERIVNRGIKPHEIKAGRPALSQSERDWAYAKRALARGDSPHAVIHAIADYRRDDKPNPMYYARLTVEKAMASLMTPGDRAETIER